MNFSLKPEEVFAAEIGKINSDIHVLICLKALDKVPDYFWVIPSSSSGKYHPRNDLGIGGNVYHTKAVFWLSEELLSHPLYAPFDDKTKDDIRVAILLHDSCKQGEGEPTGHTVSNHPLIPRKILTPWGENDVVSAELAETWNRICDLIETHMGIWTKDRKTGEEILDEPKSGAQKFVHMCDFLASKRAVEIDVTQYRSCNSTNNTNPNWREEVASDGQIQFLKKLMYQCRTSGIPVSPIVITDRNNEVCLKKGAACDLIQELKSKLETPR